MSDRLTRAAELAYRTSPSPENAQRWAELVIRQSEPGTLPAPLHIERVGANVTHLETDAGRYCWSYNTCVAFRPRIDLGTFCLPGTTSEIPRRLAFVAVQRSKTSANHIGKWLRAQGMSWEDTIAVEDKVLEDFTRLAGYWSDATVKLLAWGEPK